MIQQERPYYWDHLESAYPHIQYCYQQAAVPAHSSFSMNSDGSAHARFQTYIMHNMPQNINQQFCMQSRVPVTSGYASPNGSNFSMSDISGSYESAIMSDQPIRYKHSPVRMVQPPNFKIEVEDVSHVNQHAYTASHFPYRHQSMKMEDSMPSPVSNQSRHQSRLSSEDVVSSNDKFDDGLANLTVRSIDRTLLPGDLNVSNGADQLDSIEVSETVRVKLPESPFEEHVEDLSEAPAVQEDSDSDYNDYGRRRRSSRNSTGRSTTSPRHRRKSSTHSTIGHGRVHKGTKSGSTSTPTRRIRSSKSKKGPAFTITAPRVDKGDRNFPCSFHQFGCLSTFPNKNEWKRHVACQHLQLGYYRCDLDICNPDIASFNNKRQVSQILAKRSRSTDRYQSYSDSLSEDDIIKVYNDFNRKDLFTQHCRRMHGPARNPALCLSVNKRGNCQPTKDEEAAFEMDLDEIRRRCWHVRRRAPSRSNCGFCTQIFDADYVTNPGTAEQGPEEVAWEQRMEHVGRHYEKEGVEQENEELDEDLVAWGLECGILTRLPCGRPWLVGASFPSSEEEQGGDSHGLQPVKRTRRQPSRTVVVQKRTQSTTVEDLVTDDDAEAEDE